MPNGPNRRSWPTRWVSLAVLGSVLVLLCACNGFSGPDGGWLGLEVEPLPAAAERLPGGLGWPPRGVLVAAAAGPAASAGLRKGDVVTRVNGRTVTDVPSFEEVAAGLSQGMATQIEIVRGTVPLSVVVPAPQGPLGVASPGVAGPIRPAPPAGPALVGLTTRGPAGASLPMVGVPAAPRAPVAPVAPVAPAATAVQIPALGIEVVDLGALGVGVHRIYRGSWGERAGLAVQDQVVALGGKPVDGLARFAELLGRAPAEQPVTMQVRRGAAMLSLQVTVGEGELETTTVPADAATAYAPAVPAPGAGAPAIAGSPQTTAPGEPAGILVRKLGMRVAAGQDGAAVVGVLGNSHAARGGLRVGDLVVRAGHTRVKTMRRFRRLVTLAPPASSLELGIVRAGRVQSVTVQVGEGEMEGVTPVAPP